MIAAQRDAAHGGIDKAGVAVIVIIDGENDVVTAPRKPCGQQRPDTLRAAAAHCMRVEQQFARLIRHAGQGLGSGQQIGGRADDHRVNAVFKVS